ncbi:uncharacterized protein LOC117642922 [Thrips palmi]|uniref:Uncharacterized protein LOC117642922 n=1 Tax=Thrips palmi TaxID=161013 RepID=A0A6P8YL04_THRPL|nr:uncharacterized protein LOC117642922 [Thrips palmi]
MKNKKKNIDRKQFKKSAFFGVFGSVYIPHERQRDEFNPTDAPRGPCAVCGEDGLPCARCRVHYYCGKEHQRQHWPRHRAGCGSVEAREGGLVATRDIPAETVILREIPRVTFADLQAHGTLEQRLCFGCHGPLQRRRGRQCQRCGVPVCAEECSDDGRHAAECRAFQRAQFRVPEAYAAGDDDNFVILAVAVRTLRTALATQRDSRIEKLPVTVDVDEDCERGLTEAMRTSMRWYQETLSAGLRRVAVEWLRETAGVAWLSEAELSRAALVNHVLGESVFDRDMKPCWGLFVGSSLMEPSCIPNTAQLPLDDRLNSREYVTVTSRDVAAGEHLTELRARWWDDSRRRRTHVSLKRGVVCWCARCRDPTELGMYVGSPCCPSCAENGKLSYVIAVTWDFQEWKCEACGKTMSEIQVDALTKAARQELEQCFSERNWTEFLSKYVFPRGPLHDTHSLVFQALEALRTCVVTPAQLDSAVTSQAPLLQQGEGPAGAERLSVLPALCEQERAGNWRCTDRAGCNARVHTNADLSNLRLLKDASAHLGHVEDHRAIEGRKVMQALKRRAREEPNDAPQRIIRQAVAAVDDPEVLAKLPERQCVRRVVNIHQNIGRFRNPQLLQDIDLNAPYTTTMRGTRFLLHDSDDVTRWVDTCRRLQRGLDRLLPGVSEGRLVLSMSLRYLLLCRFPKPQDSLNDYFLSRGMEVHSYRPKERFQGDLDALKQEILEATHVVLRHLFSRDDAEPKLTLRDFPFVDF